MHSATNIEDFIFMLFMLLNRRCANISTGVVAVMTHQSMVNVALVPAVELCAKQCDLFPSIANMFQSCTDTAGEKTMEDETCVLELPVEIGECTMFNAGHHMSPFLHFSAVLMYL